MTQWSPAEILHPFAPAWSPVFWNLAERLEARFGALPDRLIQEIEPMDDVPKLEEAFVRSLDLG